MGLGTAASRTTLKTSPLEHAEAVPTADEAAATDQHAPAARKLSRTAAARKPAKPLKSGGKAIAGRKQRRHHREEHAADAPAAEEPSKQTAKLRKQLAKRRKMAAAAAAVPKDVGATASARHAAFGGSADRARQKAEYHARKAAEHIEKFVDKGKPTQAAAILGGMLRRPMAHSTTGSW